MQDTTIILINKLDRSMTKRQHFTLDEVLDNVLSDDEDYDDLDEPIMEGSDDEFSDLDVLDSDDDEPMNIDINPSHSSTAHRTTDPQGLLVVPIH